MMQKVKYALFEKFCYFAVHNIEKLVILITNHIEKSDLAYYNNKALCILIMIQRTFLPEDERPDMETPDEEKPNQENPIQ